MDGSWKGCGRCFGLREQALPEVVDLAEARKTIATDAMYVEPTELHRIDDGRILRYDLTLPILLTVRYAGRTVRLLASGKAYRLCQVDAMHLEAFHQAEVLWLDDRDRINAWQATARVLQSVDRVLPGRTVKIVPTQYAMCSQAWELEVETDGHWSEVLAWGVFTDRIVRHLGGDPNVTRRSVLATVSNGLRCCDTESTTSANSMSQASLNRYAGARSHQAG